MNNSEQLFYIHTQCHCTSDYQDYLVETETAQQSRQSKFSVCNISPSEYVYSYWTNDAAVLFFRYFIAVWIIHCCFLSNVSRMLWRWRISLRSCFLWNLFWQNKLRFLWVKWVVKWVSKWWEKYDSKWLVKQDN